MRADLYIVTRQGAASRTLAQKLIADGAVTIDGTRIEKPSEEIADGAHELTIAPTDDTRYVGRGGLKLEAAIRAFPAFAASVPGSVAADIGASTGGFTDCLLQNGAARVYCVDAGHGQLHPTVAGDPRVRSAEGCNARFLAPQVLRRLEPEGINPDGSPFSGQVDGCVMDVSFISQTLILPALATVVRPGGFLVSLIKPQFEAGASALSRHGVVTREKDRQTAVGRVLESAQVCGFLSRGVIPSPIEGGDGNREFIAYFIRGGL